MSKVRFAGQPSYITPPIAPFFAGPAGFACNPGTALDPSWKNHFFVTSYTGSPANARTFGFTLNAEGRRVRAGRDEADAAGRAGAGHEDRPRRRDLPHRLGAAAGRRPAKAGVWKLDSIAGKGSAARTAVQALLKENFASRPVPGLVELLRHEDQRVRLKAQFELVRRGDQAALTGAATSTERRTAAKDSCRASTRSGASASCCGAAACRRRR